VQGRHVDESQALAEVRMGVPVKQATVLLPRAVPEATPTMPAYASIHPFRKSRRVARDLGWNSPRSRSVCLADLIARASSYVRADSLRCLPAAR
jgi:hypothetical protein